MKHVVSLRGLKENGRGDRLSIAEARHQELEARLRELGRHAHLTPTEQLEITELKKRKLRMKDEMSSLRRRD